MGTPMRTPKKISQTNWINWDELVERVRGAKTSEVAIARLKKDLDLALKLREHSVASEAVEDERLHKRIKENMARCQAMAAAMAYPEGEESGDFLELASRVDRALTARKKHET